MPPEVDRSMTLCEYDGGKPEEQGGPTLGAVLDDLGTLSFFAGRRVVVVREADKFISTHRDRLEAYCAAPHESGVLIMECRSFPKNTRLYKAADKARAALIECKKLNDRGLADFVVDAAAERGKRMSRSTAERLVELIGQEQGQLANEVEKLSLFVGDRPQISDEDVSELVGPSREEKIFAVMDAAAGGRLREALELWEQVLATDRAAAYRAVGGLAFVLRRWLAAHQMRSDGMNVAQIAPKVMMWGRQQELAALLDRQNPQQIRQALGRLAALDAEAKVGARSIELGVSALLTEIAAPR